MKPFKGLCCKRNIRAKSNRMRAYTAGFSPRPWKGGRCERCACFMAFLAPHCPSVLSILNLRAALGKNLLVLKISVLPSKLSREWNSRTSKQRDFDQQVWKPLATETGLSSRKVEKPVLLSHLPLSFIKILGKRLCLSCDSVSLSVKERPLTFEGHLAISRRHEYIQSSSALSWDPAIPRRKYLLLLLCSCKITENV